MAFQIKYKVKDLAYHLNLHYNVVAKILEQYDIHVVNHIQKLTDEEISIVLTYLINHPKEYDYLPDDSPLRYKPDDRITQMQPIIIKWSDEDYYVLNIRSDLRLTRKVLVECCSNNARYFNSYDRAKEAAVNYIKNPPTNFIPKEYNIEEFPICSDDE